MSDVNAVHDDNDGPLLDLLDALVSDRGRTAAARSLGVNYRTLVNCWDSRRVSRRMRQVLEEFRDAGGVGGDVDAEVVDGDPANDMDSESLERRVAVLENENRGLRELVEEQTGQLEELARRVAALEGTRQQGDNAESVDAGDVHGDDQGNDFGQDWRPPRRRPGMPDAGVVTLDEQPDEEHAFGPAAPLVVEWREIRIRAQDGVSGGSRVDRALTAIRRWELEAAMLREYHLTLPPETHPLDDARTADHVRWRQEALAEARRELGRAKGMGLIKRILTLGLWEQ